MVTLILVCTFLGFSILLTGLFFLTEEQSEEAEGAGKPASVAEDDERDTCERDNSEGKNSNKDSGKMLASLTFLPPTPHPNPADPPPLPRHSLQSALPSPPTKAY